MISPSHCRPLILLLCLGLCTACGSSGSGSSAPVGGIGAIEKTINARWDVDPASVACIPENLELTCSYLYHGVHITASYNQRHQAEQFIVDGLAHHSVNMWTFLNTMVPSGARRIGCRYVANSSGGGTAHVCLYQGSHNVIVAYFPHPNDPSFGGIVAYDYASYRDVEPEDR